MTAKEFGTPGPRSIYPEICDSRSLARCGILANALWPRLLVRCDDQGRMPGDAGDVLGECFPKMLSKVSVRAVQAALGELSAEHMVKVYKASGETYLQVLAWWRWQHYAKRAYPSRFPAPEGWTDYVYGREGVDEVRTYREAAGVAKRKRKDVVADEPDLRDWPTPTEAPDGDELPSDGPLPDSKLPPSWRQGDATVTPPRRQADAFVATPPRARDSVPSLPVPSRPLSPKSPSKLGTRSRGNGTNPRAQGDSPRQREQAVKDGLLDALAEMRPDGFAMPGTRPKPDDDWTGETS